MKFSVLVILAVLAANPSGAQTESIPTLEKAAIRRVNAERSGRGLGILKQDDLLAGAARQHSEEMRDLGYISHTSPRDEFRTASRRLAWAGISDAESAENLGHFASNDPADTLPVFVRRIHAGLMKSPGHRANILNPGFNTVGIGIAVGRAADAKHPETGLPAMWMTQNFVSRRVVLDSAAVRKTPRGPELEIKGSTGSASRLFLVIRTADKEDFMELRPSSGRFSASAGMPKDASEITVELCLRRKGNVCAVTNVLLVDPSLLGQSAVRSGLGRE